MAAQSYLVGAAGFLLFAACFIVLLRIRLPIGWFLLEILLGILIHLLASAAGFLLMDGFSYWYNASLFAFLWFCFFFVTSIYSVSVSVGIISYLYKRPGRTAPLGDTFELCVLQPFRERAGFLVATGQASRVGERYAATEAGRRTVRRLRLLHRILGMTSHGFYSTRSDLLHDPDSSQAKP
jgi:hypothetical protein